MRRRLVKPGETVTIKLHAAQPTQAVVFAVDEGILQVAHYKLGDPLDFFFRKRMLEVQTCADSRSDPARVQETAGMAAPGGDGDDAIGAPAQSVQDASTDKPVVYLVRASSM